MATGALAYLSNRSLTPAISPSAARQTTATQSPWTTEGQPTPPHDDLFNIRGRIRHDGENRKQKHKGLAQRQSKLLMSFQLAKLIIRQSLTNTLTNAHYLLLSTQQE